MLVLDDKCQNEWWITRDEIMSAKMVRNLFMMKVEIAFVLKDGWDLGRQSAVGGTAGKSTVLVRTRAGHIHMEIGSGKRAYLGEEEMGGQCCWHYPYKLYHIIKENRIKDCLVFIFKVQLTLEQHGRLKALTPMQLKI